MRVDNSEKLARLMSGDDWREVSTARGYFVSRSGRVVSGRRGVELRPSISKHGYRIVSVSIAGKSTSRPVHRLVAEAFIGPPPPGHVCNHRDGDKLRNDVDNLEWVTPKQNSQHAASLGLLSGLGPDNIKRVHELRAQGWSISELVLIFDVPENRIREALGDQRYRLTVPQLGGELCTNENE